MSTIHLGKVANHLNKHNFHNENAVCPRTAVICGGTGEGTPGPFSAAALTRKLLELGKESWADG